MPRSTDSEQAGNETRFSPTVTAGLPQAGSATSPTPETPPQTNEGWQGIEGGQVAALYVETDGCYFNLEGVIPWDIGRDARDYLGPHPVVAHPPCQRWGRFWHGSTRKPHQFQLGDDDGCFAHALSAVRRFGGVLEHPADSRAWAHFGLTPPQRYMGWQRADLHDGWTCYVEQGHYGHTSRKPTWLYAVGIDKPHLHFGPSGQRLPQWMIDRYGYEKARRIGVVAMVGGKDKTKIRNATPPPFRDLLISMARSVKFDRLSAYHTPETPPQTNEGWQGVAR